MQKHVVKSTLDHTGTKHDTKAKADTHVSAGTPGPKEVVRAAAAKAKAAGKDPLEASKAAIAKIAKNAKKEGIKPGPKNIASAAAHMAHHEGQDPKKAAKFAVK